MRCGGMNINDDVDHDDDDRGTASVSNCLRRWLGGEHFADKPFDDDYDDDDDVDLGDDDVDNDDDDNDNDDNDDVDHGDDDRGTALLCPTARGDGLKVSSSNILMTIFSITDCDDININDKTNDDDDDNDYGDDNHPNNHQNEFHLQALHRR